MRFDKKYLFVGLLATLLLALVEPVIGIRDIDSYSYVVGAYSIQQGRGYVDLMGMSLIHWPPGYSLLLSLFPDPLAAARWINFIAFGVALMLVFFLARKSEWNVVAAGSLCAALGFGFFRGIATNAAPDILQYALFLTGLVLYTRQSNHARLAGLILWALLIPLKYIALVFVPAGLAVDLWRAQDAARLNHFQRIGAGAIFVLVIGALLNFNYNASGALIASSHDATGITGAINAGVEFVFSFGRGLLAYWYGSVREPVAFGAFALLLVCAIVALATLRPQRQRFVYLYLGAAILALSAVLMLVRNFDATMRLMAYGPLTLLFAFRPLARWNWVWVAYGIAAIGVGLLNVLSTNALGANDPRYQAMAQTLQARGLPDGIIMSNSFHILDVQLRHPSRAVSETPTDGDYYLYVTLPSYDATASSVTPLPPPTDGWCLLYDIEQAQMYQRCAAP